MTNEATEQAAERVQYITFRASDQDFAADIMSIREIRGWSSTTPIPHVAEYVRGIINLRGKVLPVIDLKARLGGGLTEVSPSTVIVVVDTREHTVGVLVDAVVDILAVSRDQVQGVPEIVGDASNGYVEGIAVIDDKMVTLLDMQRLTASQDSIGGSTQEQ